VVDKTFPGDDRPGTLAVFLLHITMYPVSRSSAFGQDQNIGYTQNKENSLQQAAIMSLDDKLGIILKSIEFKRVPNLIIEDWTI
jgi:predicted lactoylglutathione lyase